MSDIEPTTLPALPEQELLFDELSFFVGGNSEAAERYHRHTGRRLDRNVAEAIVERRALGMSERSVAETFHVSRNTVAALMQEAERLGKLEPVKARLGRRLGLILDLATDEIVERLRTGHIPDNVLPILLGVVFDKKSLLDGDPTIRIEERIEVALTPEDMRSMLERMKRAEPAVIDVQPVAEGSCSRVEQSIELLALPKPPVDTKSTVQPPANPNPQPLT